MAHDSYLRKKPVLNNDRPYSTYKRKYLPNLNTSKAAAVVERTQNIINSICTSVQISPNKLTMRDIMYDGIEPQVV